MNGSRRKWQMSVLIALALATAAGAAQPVEPTGILTLVADGVQVTGPGVETTPLAKVWQVVRSGVTIRVPKGASAGIVCSNRRFVLLRGPATWILKDQTCMAGKELTPAEYALVAPQAGRFKVIDGLLVLEREIRSGESVHPLAPVVLSPRNTRLRSLRPSVYWYQVHAATEYQVLWTGSEMEVLEIVVKPDAACAGNPERLNLCTLPWPIDRPELRPGGTFSLRVSARDSIVGPWHATDSVEVHALSLSEGNALDEASERLAGFYLSGGVVEASQAGLLAQKQLYSAAIDGYTQALAISSTPELKVTLADLYMVIGLFHLAETIYGEVLETGTPAARAAATLGVGRIEHARGHYDAAAASFRRARNLYASVDGAKEEAEACRAAERASARLGALRRDL